MTRSHGWDRPLPKPLHTGNVTITTLAEARAYINAVGARGWAVPVLEGSGEAYPCGGRARRFDWGSRHATGVSSVLRWEIGTVIKTGCSSDNRF